ncbi:MAG TPA: hypothetical protein PKD86_18325, partial [Gemmatales bacterium]|nr:hypothetical protein [Gemmatales bacterium]
LREDYPELEEETAGERIAGCRAQGRDVHFISLDLTTTCWVRCFRSASATLLVLCQAHDLEADHLEPVFRALRKSMRLADAAPAK